MKNPAEAPSVPLFFLQPGGFAKRKTKRKRVGVIEDHPSPDGATLFLKSEAT
jgi:hypothetical protein